MATFVVYSLLGQKDAQYAYDGIRKWFKDHPDRNECVTESFTVRRDHVKEDILAASAKGVVLAEKKTKKKVTKKPVKKTTLKKTTKKTVKKPTKKVAR